MPLKILIAFIAFLSISHSSFAHNGIEHDAAQISLSALSSYKSGPFDQGAAEIVAYDPGTQRAFVTNGFTKAIDVLNLSKPEHPSLDFSIDLKPYGTPNSVAVKNGMLAVAVAASPKQAPGSVVVFALDGQHLNTFRTGALPDMVTFTPDAKFILTANEGEPNGDYSIDPEGSISLIGVGDDISKQTQNAVRTADFKRFKRSELDPRIRIFGINASVAQDLEPEFIAVSADATTAWVSLQENNALAVVNIQTGVVERLIALGTQSHNNAKTAIDASDQDNSTRILPWPVQGMYQPDTIATYEVDGQTYLVTANEGDARDYDGYSEEVRIGKLPLDKTSFDRKHKFKHENNLGRLKVSNVGADADGDGQVDTLFTFGTRSFSIWNVDGKRIYDSGSQFARIVARDHPELFNAGDSRSDDKGSEPEALAIGKVGEETYAFIGLERTGGVMVYNISDPKNAFYVDYLNTIKPHLALDHPDVGDISPESIVFVSADNSPDSKPFIITANETSSTVSLYRVHTENTKIK